MIALAWPIGLLQLSYIVDNPWSVALNRAERAGILLARECLAKAIQGGRPVSLCGYGMGARVVYYCCVELWELGCFGLIDSVFLAGAPVVVEISSYSTTNNILNPEKENDKNIIGSGGSSKAEGDGKNQPTASPLSSGWTKMRQVCAGRVVNGYSKNDWLLRFLFRGLVGGQMLAGLGPVCDDNLAIENIDLSDLVAGHLKYKEALPEILKQFKVQD